MDNVVHATVSIPSSKPVDNMMLTSSFGVRSDPFNGRRRAHKGIDIPGPVGTPIYATADGIVGRSQWVGGYGNLVDINHGNGIETRYGHMSKLIVAPNQRVRRGQVIGLMGSTGRSTGSHLHYEVRIDGEAVNPIPFIQSSDYLLALNSKPPVAMGGPEKE
jgi:murein DD-endopeptidase MepM/ murein hydrolase activator NlpD